MTITIAAKYIKYFFVPISVNWPIIFLNILIKIFNKIYLFDTIRNKGIKAKGSFNAYRIFRAPVAVSRFI